MNLYARIEDYEALYAKYLEKPVSDMVDLAGDMRGKVVWDLCCGGGALSEACLSRGASDVSAVDACPGMTFKLRWSMQSRRGFRLEVADVGAWLECAYSTEPDFVFCRQAVNYWLNKGTAKLLAARTKPGSVFVFNTFNTRPSYRPMVKEYEVEGKVFVEVSWLVPPDMVYHVQMREGMNAHQTEFRWIPPSEYLDLLGESWEVTVHESKGSSMYRCVRK